MRSSSKRLAGAALVCLAPALAVPAFSDGPDPHLRVVPRTPAEAGRVAAVLAPADPGAAHRFESMPGGAATVARFGDRQTNLSAETAFAAETGVALFDRLWVASPASTRGSDGLGPLYNARACAACHLGAARAGDASPDGLVARLSGPGREPHPTLGLQLQTAAAPGRQAEGALVVTWEESAVTLPDGTRVPLRAPVPSGVPEVAGIDLRLAPQLIGLGLLEAIPEADIRAGADPHDRDGDGISGRAAEVFSPETGGRTLGRFGHKAAHATLIDQTAAAFAVDMGLSSPLAADPWGDCTPAQAECRAGPHGADPGLRDGTEVSADTLRRVALHVATLGVPRRSGADAPAVLRGRALFHETGCAACHRPAFVTHRLADRPEHGFQLVWPYTDLLLHDLGPGLAARAGEGDATAAEWRTAPLWGLGHALGNGQGLLHDGRARTALEAILWHGGEAERARDRAARLSAADRADLVAFLESL